MSKSLVWLVAALMAGCSLFRNDGNALTVRTDKKQYRVGEEVTVRVVNRTPDAALFVFYCSFAVQRETEAGWETVATVVCPPNVRVGTVAIKGGTTYTTEVQLRLEETELPLLQTIRLQFSAFKEDGTPLDEEQASSNGFRLTQ